MTLRRTRCRIRGCACFGRNHSIHTPPLPNHTAETQNLPDPPIAAPASRQPRLHRRQFQRFILIGAVCFIWLTHFQGELRGQAGFITPRVRTEGVEMPVYLDGDSKPAAILRVKTIFTDYQRRGFFRIGLLPVLVCDQVTFEFCDTERVTNALVRLRACLKPFASGTAMEMRQAAFQFPVEPGPRLTAGTVRVRDGNQWLLSDVVVRSPTNSIHVARALLHISGEEAGRLTWESSEGPSAINLFAPQTSPDHTATVQKSP